MTDGPGGTSRLRRSTLPHWPVRALRPRYPKRSALGKEPTLTIPKPPRGAQRAGKALWDAVVAVYELEEHELLLLREMVRTVDTLDALEARVAADGVLLDSSQGERAHPALVEARQQRIALARLQAALRLPAGEEESGDQRRPQRRTGVRGVYGLGVA